MPPTWMRYAVTQGFGPTSEPLDSGGVNKGIDYATPLGTPIDAAVGGTVEAVGDSRDGWGISVKVRDAQGNLHNYGHLSAVNVRRGQKVTAGMVVGKSGNTGKSTGPHLSYDVSNKAGAFVDPAPFLGQKPQPGKTPQPGKKPGLTPGDEQRLMGVFRKISRGQTLTPDEAVFAQPYLDEQNDIARGVAEGMFGAGSVTVLNRAGSVVGRVLGAAKAHPKAALAAAAAAAWKFDVPFVGGDGGKGDEQVAPDQEQIARIMQKVAAAQSLLPEEIGLLREAAPDVAAQYEAEAGTDDGGTPYEALDTEGKSNADILDALLRALVEEGDYDPADVAKIAQLAQQTRDAEKKQLRLDDGTIITSEMIAGADPVTRQQYQQELDSRTRKSDEEAYDWLNKYALDSYALGRTATNDANANSNNDYRNRIEAVRQRLDLDEITIDQASKEVSRMLSGMGESRARADLETETALKAAPFATVGGKTSFTGQDLGPAISGLAGIGGVQNPNTTPLIQFPGTQRIDVAGLMAQRDAELGVTGALPEIPKITVPAGDIPAPPTFAAGPAVPTLQMPARPAALSIPGAWFDPSPTP